MDGLSSKLNVLFMVIVGLIAGYAWHKGSAPKPLPNDAWFLAQVSNHPETVLVKFGAPWCPPCRMLDPELDRLSSTMRGRVSVVRVDVGSHQDLARHYGVSSIPRMLLFRNGKVVADRTGYADAQRLNDWVASNETK